MDLLAVSSNILLALSSSVTSFMVPNKAITSPLSFNIFPDKKDAKNLSPFFLKNSS